MTSEYPYFVRASLQCTLPSLLLRFGNPPGQISTMEGNSALYTNGLHTEFNIPFYIADSSKSGFQTYMFRSKDEFTLLLNTVVSMSREAESEMKSPLYTWSPNSGWHHSSYYAKREPKDLLGYGSYVEKILKDVHNYKKYIEFLKKIGEDFHSLNYLLYGPPGVGKTTLIKVIATELNLPIYVVRGDAAEKAPISSILNPKGVTSMRIVLFEDFDRFLEKDAKQSTNKMADILNCLDGVENSNNVIRFFTGNNCDVIFQNEALLSRMNGRFEFTYPDYEDFMAKLRILLQFHEGVNTPTEDEIQAFSALLKKRVNNLLAPTQLTLRPFTAFVIRYLFEDNCLDAMTKHFNELG